MLALKNTDLPNYTYDDYVQWEGRWELINGIPYAMSPAPSFNHQRINSRIIGLLFNALENCGKCQSTMFLDYKVTDDTVFQPDVVVVCEPFDKGEVLTKAPEIIFEILSPSTKKKDLNLKYDIYEKEGVKYYVIVDPFEDIASVYKLVEGKYQLMLKTGTDSFEFEAGPCKFMFDFARIW